MIDRCALEDNIVRFMDEDPNCESEQSDVALEVYSRGFGRYHLRKTFKSTRRILLVTI